jgi:spoIIIJ-associated protein
MEQEELLSFCRELLELLGVEVTTIEIKQGSVGKINRMVVAISSTDAERLIGPQGEHLKALTVIARRMVEHIHGEEAANFLLDVNDFHEAQLEQIRQKARMSAQRARLFKHDIDLDPMSPYDRLVIHELFANDPEIQTESAGEGAFRHIVLKYKNSPSL